MKRRSLFHREVPMGDDVADAIDKIISLDGTGLPMAISKEDVLDQLVIMASTNDEDIVVEQSASARRFVRLSFQNTLTESTVFQSGYERYEARTKNPAIPVTEYFFRYIYKDDVRDCLDGMMPIEIMQSLPKRPSRPVQEVIDPDGTVRKEPIKDTDTNENGEEVYIPAQKVGKIAGVVVCPNGDAKTGLLAEWIRRRGAVAIGVQEKTIKRFENARGYELGMLRDSSKEFRKEISHATPNVQPGTDSTQL